MESENTLLFHPLLRLQSNHQNLRTRASFFILVTVCFWYVSFYGISSNLVLFFTQVVHYDNATAASNTAIWFGSMALCSFIGAVLADSVMGKLWTSVAFQVFNLMAMALLSFCTSELVASGQTGPSRSLISLFYISLYLIALANGAFQPTLLSLGADQFDTYADKSSYFSRYLESANVGIACALTGIMYAMRQQGWPFGFWLCTGVGAIAFSVFLIGSPIYKHYMPTGISREECTIKRVSEMKCVIRLLPIWVSSIFFYVIYTQPGTLFIEQGDTMNTQLGKFRIEPVNMNLFNIVTVILSPTIYERVINAWFRHLKHDSIRSLSPLQRMGIGHVISCIAILSAALVETKRLKSAREENTVSILWLIPAYSLLGAAQFFISFGLSEFFYSEAPQSLRSLGCSLLFMSMALGNYMSALLVAVVNRISTWEVSGGSSWIPKDLNKGHLDYFYLTLSLLTAFNFLFFVNCAIRFQSSSHEDIQGYLQA